MNWTNILFKTIVHKIQFKSFVLKFDSKTKKMYIASKLHNKNFTLTIN
ncbi:MAG: hypothetical protein RIT22_384 [Bacteroidota bacterium]|jgi:hypothetical protein